MAMRRGFWAVLFLSFLIVSCNDDDNDKRGNLPPGAAQIGASGGTVNSSDGKVSLTIPPGALTEEITITIEEGAGAAPSGAIEATVYEVGPSGLQFNSAATIRIKYEEENLPAELQGRESDLRVGVVEEGDWVETDRSSVDLNEREVSGRVTHLSTFGAISVVDPSSGEETRLFYTANDALFAVNPAKSAHPTLVDSDLLRSSPVLSGRWDPSTQTVADPSVGSVVYPKEDGKLYRVSGVGTDSLASRQISSEEQMESMQICSSQTWEDGADIDASVYIYRFSGDDEECSTSDDLQRMVRIGMAADEEPLVISLDLTPQLPLYAPASGAIDGWLAIDNLERFVRCDRDLESCSLLGASGKSISVAGENVFTGDLVLKTVEVVSNVDRVILRSYDVVGGTLSASRYTFSAPGPNLDFASDGTDLFFADGSALKRLPLEGSGSPTTLTTESGSIDQIELTDNNVIFNVATSSTRSLKAIGKTGGGATTLVQTTEDILGQLRATGNRVYYSRIGSTAKIGMVGDDGSNGREISGAAWAGRALRTSTKGGGVLSLRDGKGVLDRLVWVEGCSLTSFGLRCPGGTVKSIAAETGTDEVILGTLPSDFSGFFVSGFGEEVLALASAAGGGDLFYANVGEADSLVRVTTAPTTFEDLLIDFR
jgi:hypothetical protein